MVLVSDSARSRTELTSNNYAEIVQQLMPIKNDWEVIANALGFKPNEVEDIRRNPGRFHDGNYIFDVIEFWLRWAPPDKRGSEDVATLERLQDALDSTNHANIRLKMSKK